MKANCRCFQQNPWKILKEMGIPDHLTCLLRNLYTDQEATVRKVCGTMDQFKIGKRVHQGCILSPCLFILYAEYITQNAGLDETQAGIKIAERNINNLRHASVAPSCPTLCDPMECNMSGFPVHHQLLELSQTHVYRVSDAIQPSYSLSSPPAFNLSQHQGLLYLVSSLHQVDKGLELQLQHQSF